MRITLQVRAVLEGAGLAFVNVDGHQFGGWLLAHDAPFTPCKKASTAQAAQAGVFHGLDHGLGLNLALGQRRRQRVAALGTVAFIADISRRHLLLCGHGRDTLFSMVCGTETGGIRGSRVTACSFFHLGQNRFRGGGQHRALVHHGHGRLFTAPQTGRGNHAYIGMPQQGWQTLQ